MFWLGLVIGLFGVPLVVCGLSILWCWLIPKYDVWEK